MLLSALNDVQRQGIVPGAYYEAVVKDVDDPMRLHRVRASIVGIMDKWPVEALPWAFSLRHRVSGGKKNSGSQMFCPAVGSKVLLVFQERDPYNPLYVDYPLTEDTGIDEITNDPDYPHRGILFRVPDGSVQWYQDDHIQDPERKSSYFHRNVGNVGLWFERKMRQHVAKDYEFDAADQTLIVTADGKLIRQYYGSKRQVLQEGDLELVVNGKTIRIQSGEHRSLHEKGIVVKTNTKVTVVALHDLALTAGNDLLLQARGDIRLRADGKITRNQEILEDSGGRTITEKLESGVPEDTEDTRGDKSDASNAKEIARFNAGVKAIMGEELGKLVSQLNASLSQVPGFAPLQAPQLQGEPIAELELDGGRYVNESEHPLESDALDIKKSFDEGKPDVDSSTG